MRLTWHEAKRQATLAERGLDFADCGEVFSGPTHNFQDDRKPYPETRIISVGFLRGRMVVVVYTPAGKAMAACWACGSFQRCFRIKGPIPA